MSKRLIKNVNKGAAQADQGGSSLKKTQQKATKKYRRIKTIVGKTVETSALCDI